MGVPSLVQGDGIGHHLAFSKIHPIGEDYPNFDGTGKLLPLRRSDAGCATERMKPTRNSPDFRDAFRRFDFEVMAVILNSMHAVHVVHFQFT